MKRCLICSIRVFIQLFPPRDHWDHLEIWPPFLTLALVLSTDEQDLEEFSGIAEYQGSTLTGKEAMSRAGILRIILEAKEGIALNNGATFSAAIAALVCFEGARLLEVSDIALAMSLEALLGISTAFDPRIHESRQHPGQIKTAEKIRLLTRESTLLDSSNRVQDAYSLRCGPQVHGPAKETLDFTKEGNLKGNQRRNR